MKRKSTDTVFRKLLRGRSPASKYLYIYSEKGVKRIPKKTTFKKMSKEDKKDIEYKSYKRKDMLREKSLSKKPKSQIHTKISSKTPVRTGALHTVREIQPTGYGDIRYQVDSPKKGSGKTTGLISRRSHDTGGAFPKQIIKEGKIPKSGEAAYSHISKKYGITIRPGYRTEEGENMWKGFKKSGLADTHEDHGKITPKTSKQYSEKSYKTRTSKQARRGKFKLAPKTLRFRGGGMGVPFKGIMNRNWWSILE